MAGGVEGRHGGIQGLLRLLDDRKIEGAIQSDLLDRGRSLEELGDSLSWWDLWCIVEHLPAKSAYRRHVEPDGIYRTAENMLRILAADGARGGSSLWDSLVAESAEVAPAKPKVVIDARAVLAARTAAFVAQQGESAS